MKIAVSNIAWENEKRSEHLDLLSELDCDAVEIAPSCIWSEPTLASKSERVGLRREIYGRGLRIAGLHSLLYGHAELKLFRSKETRDQTVAYLIRLAELCADLEGEILTFGSPPSRTLENREYDECVLWAQEAFWEIAQTCSRYGVTFCIEALGTEDTEFITSVSEAIDLVRGVNHECFRLQIDTKCLFSTGESLEGLLESGGDLLRHFHVSDPGLAPPGSTGASHAAFGAALRAHSYEDYISIEMRRGIKNTLKTLSMSVAVVRHDYLGGQSFG